MSERKETVLSAKYETEEAQKILEYCKSKNITPSTLIRVAISTYILQNNGTNSQFIPTTKPQDMLEIVTQRVTTLRNQGKCYESCYAKAKMQDQKAPWEPIHCANLLAKDRFFCLIYETTYKRPASGSPT